MEDLRDRLLDLWDWIRDRFDDLRDFMAENPNVKRWIAEGCGALAIGIIAGFITFSVLNHEKKGLAVSQENAATPVQEQTAEENIEASSQVDDNATENYDDVVIEVVDASGYVGDLANWSPEQIDAAVSERSGYLEGNKYWNAVQGFWEAKGVTGNARFCMYMYDTSGTVYSPSDFDGLAPEVIHAIKNEMYARHGYAFRDKDLYNYFMGQIWYNPTVKPGDFSEKTFSETEVKNLDMLNSIDSL